MSVKGFQLDRYLFIVCVIEFMRFQFTEKNRYTLHGISKDYGSILPRVLCVKRSTLELVSLVAR